MGGSDQWAPQAPLGEGREVIALDLPGFGRNAHLPPIDRIEGFADWVLETLTAQGVQRFDLLGHSMGGMVVQEMVRQAPDRIARLVLYGTGAVGVLPGRFEPIETSMQRARTDGPQATARRISATWFLHTEAAKAYEGCAMIAERAGLPAILAGLEAMRGWSGADHLADITAPTLIVWGDRDRTYPWSQIERLWRTIPGASLAVMPGCAHACHLERPDLFNLLVGGFLASA
ncbi:2-hydroxy-6-oxononadienedioate/2-hydroxy-6-oxononatrienedioate hydrolase [Maliponia aquimaris]|uniref:2-hydroxy-6-oxononadienedioate/2-hydroxy-6-oxononatrienedioate hydrolase n=2 Tax=Maliponia aquimaris TaxID=1673631 RepID=A0A238L7L7_9RHOB|nr:2-hydroxy-6-oxononadienedioate/2-hydroxy-6-oxononatrienedioate hydrolase [Maliponia aquimaris]